MKLDYLSALKRLHTAQGVWLLHGEEALLQQNLLDAFRQHWQQQEIERQRFDIHSVNDWKLVFSALDSLSLFAQRLAVEVHGNIKPDANGLKQLKQFLQQDSDNLLLIILPKQESASLKSAFFQTVEANGVIVPLQATYAKEQQAILQREADQLGIQLQPDAWQWLLQHHEHHLLAARNSLIRVSDTFPEQTLFDVEHLISCLQDQSRYHVYDLSDAVLQADFALSIKILRYLQESGEAMSLILWSLSREARLLMQLYEQPHNAIQLGIWKNKISLYQSALRRLPAHTFLQFPALLLRIDQAIKGMSQENPQHLCQQMIALLCGKPLFSNV
ncbi:MAG: DNA polymerase III subunit delta [Acinetobacter sp.]|nr:DNA polymerase III subunit delta [Acinetobacter sp.]